ncbi:hypothetical protein ABT340_39705 [Streptosporangium sp. NPDC000239]|uniref:hypothetical protein n=1 Tax=Streptosporangium sp. NPDC000239 TaxID=3154248 RepID=UPI003323E48A
MDLYEIYDSSGAYSYQPRPGDRAARAPLGSVEPQWSVFLYRPDVAQCGGLTIPHARLEATVVQNGVDAEDVQTIVETILHWHLMPSPDDPLAWEHGGATAFLEASADIPDPTRHLTMPSEEKAACTAARVAAVRQHLAAMDPAAYDDRAGAMAARAFDLVAAAAPQTQVAYYDRAPEPHPLDPVIGAVRLDPARIDSLRAYLAWMQARDQQPHSRATALLGPGLPGVTRDMFTSKGA